MKISNKILAVIVVFVIILGFVFIKSKAGDRLSRDASDKNGILASVGDKTFSREDLKPETKAKLSSLENQQLALMNNEINSWINRSVSALEAEKQSKTPDEIHRENIVEKSIVTNEEAFKYYAKSPDAWDHPYKEAMKLISNALRKQKMNEASRDFLSRVEADYDIRRFIKTPDAYTKHQQKQVLPFQTHNVKKASHDLKEDRVIHPPYRGPNDASVVMEVYSDFLCPYSARFSQTYNQLRSGFPDNFRVEYRHFPLEFHKGADLMAEASICAQEQRQFWPYHDALYKNVSNKNRSELLNLAKDLGLEMGPFKACLEKGRYKEMVRSDMNSGKQRGVRGTPGFLLNGKLFKGALDYKTLKKTVEWLMAPSGPFPNPSPKPPKQAPGPNAAKRAPQPPSVVSFADKELENSPFIGAKNAPVTAVVFVDFHCSFSRKASSTLDRLIETYPSELKIVFKQFPLAMHPDARKVSTAALCANDQGKYSDFQINYFGDSWPSKSDDDINKIAKDIGLNSKEFSSCTKRNLHGKEIAADILLGKEKGVRGTPTMFFNGRRVVGAQGYKKFDAIIKSELGKNKKSP